jgi:hypothetical protein
MPVMFHVTLCRLRRVVGGMLMMPASGVRVMGRLLVVTAFVRLGGLLMMTRCMPVVLGRLGVMLCGFF